VYSAQAGHATFLFSSLEHLALSPDGQQVAVHRLLRRLRDQGPAGGPSTTCCPTPPPPPSPARAVLLVGVLDKVGTFGMIRYCLELFPSAAHYFTPLLIVLAVSRRAVRPIRSPSGSATSSG